MSVASWPTRPAQGFPYPAQAVQFLDRRLPSKPSKHRRKDTSKRSNKPEALSKPSRNTASQPPNSKQSNHTSCQTNLATRLSSFTSNVKSLCPQQQRADVGKYTGFEIYEAQQREAHGRKISSCSTTSTDTDRTLVDTEDPLPAYSKDDSPEYTDSDVRETSDKVTSLRRKISPTNCGKRYSGNPIPETADEKSSRKSAKAEKKKERKNRWFGVGLLDGVEFEEGHEGQYCGWMCSKHQYLASRGAMDWWCVAGMYM